MSGYTISYFYARGRVEALRLLLSDQGQTWTDEVVSVQTWLQGDYKKSLLFGQLPKFKDGSYELYQSGAMLRYLGRKYDLCGENPHEEADMDMVSAAVEDVRNKYTKLVYSENFAEEKIPYTENLPNELKPFEQILSKNKKGSGFIVGEKISYADYALLDLLINHQALDPCCLQDFPFLAAYAERLSARPGIATYQSSEAYKKRPINVVRD